MRILITNTGPWGTGSFTVAQGILNEFIKLGHEVCLFFPDCMMPSNELQGYLDRDDIYKIWKFPHSSSEYILETFPLIIPDPHPRNPSRKTFAQLTDDELSFYQSALSDQLGSVIDQFQPDIIECQHIWLCDHIVSKLNLPYVSTAHHSDQLGFRYDPRMQPTAIASANDAKYIFAVSPYVRQEVLELYGVDQDKVIVTGNGYDQEIFQNTPIDKTQILKTFNLSIPEDATIVTFAGKLSRTKGIDTLMMANKQLNDIKIHFLIMGAGNLDEILDDLNPEDYSLDRMHFLGHQDQSNMAKLHNIADFTVMPSRSEGFGISALEAMGCGLPAIVTRCGGPEDFAIGEIIEREDPRALATAIQKLANTSSEARQELSAQAIARAREFSWKTIAEERLSYYHKAL